MKKVTSFLLALVMVVSLLPGTAMTVSAEEAAATPTQNTYYSNVIKHETFDDINTGMTKGKVGSTESRNYIVQVDGGAHIRTGVPGATGNDEVAIYDMKTAMIGGFEVTLTADFTKLETGAVAGSTAGLSVDVRAAQRCRYAFSADASGNIYLTMYGADVCFDTGLDLPATDVDVRIVADDDLNSSVVVNGRYVARFDTPAVTRPTGEYFVVYSQASVAGANDVTLYDLKLSQGPEADELQAYYTKYTPDIDGSLGEKAWAFENASIALLSDEHYLYAALKTSATTANFTVESVELTANLAAGTVTTADGKWAGAAAKSGNVAEVKIPLKSVLLNYAPGQEVIFKCDAVSFEGTAVLASRAMVSYDAALTLADAAANKTVKAKFLDPGEVDFDRPFTLEFTADFNSLVSFTSLGNYPNQKWNAGLVLDARLADTTADPCHVYGFHAKDGELYIAQRMASDAGARYATGVTLPATGVTVRIETQEDGSSLAYFNEGDPVELPVATFVVPAPGGRGQWSVHNNVVNASSTLTGTNNVTISGLSLTQDVPAAQSTEHPLASDGNKNVTAYLNLTGIEPDGLLREPQWYAPYAAAGNTGASGALVGFAWGDGNLYVGGETQDTLVTLTVGGTTLKADLANGTAVVGQLAVSSIGFEWAIPLSELNVAGGLGKQLNYRLTLAGGAGLYGTLTLSGEQVLLGDTGRGFAEKDYERNNDSGYGHTDWERSDVGYTVVPVGISGTTTASVTSSLHQSYYTQVPHTPGAYELTVTMSINDLPKIVDKFGMRGLVFQMWGEDVLAPFALRSDGDDNVILDVDYHYGTESYDTTVDIGAKNVTFRIAVDEKQIPSLYVDGAHVHTFSPIDTRNGDATKIPVGVPNFMMSANNVNRGINTDGTLGAVDVVLHDILLTQTPYADAQAVVDAALAQITEESILGGASAEDVTVMTLTREVALDDIDTEVSVAWSAINVDTGRVASNVNLKTGTVTRGTASTAFTLTAAVSYDGVVASKSFVLQTKGSKTADGKVALIVNDDDPATDTEITWNGNVHAYLDTTHNSIVVDQGTSKAFNRITLRDLDTYSRVSQRHLGVFISDDGATWTKVTGWLLHQNGSVYTLYNLKETAQYVKVHCYHDDLDYDGQQPTFYNLVSNMMKVSNETYLPGASGKFAHSNTFTTQTNSTGAEQKDVPVYVSLTTLGATAGQYKTGCADFRFTLSDGTVLAHWYNGADGFYVRVPSIPAGNSVVVTAQWGCNSAVDYSDGEAVFEVTYGNVSLINLTRETYEANNGKSAIGTHGRPFVFPNGDVIVVGRTVESNNSDLAVYRSTDGGHTFDPTPVIAYDDSWVSGRASGFGSFLWDAEKTNGDDDTTPGRLWLIGYSGKSSDETDYRVTLTHSDDWGHTWSETTFLNLEGAEEITGTNVANVTLNNSEARVTSTEIAKRSLAYCDGLKLENGRYVIIHDATVYDYTGGTLGAAKRNTTTAIYSDDGGETWTCSNTLLSNGADRSRNGEDGLTEAGFAQLDDGTLRLVIRNQAEGQYHLFEAISSNNGETWQAGTNDVLSSNTAPMLVEYGADRLQLWAACTGLGQTSYRRTPIHLGLSIDEYDTFNKIIDLTFATSFDNLQDAVSRKTNPGIAVNQDENTAFVSYQEQARIESDIWKGAKRGATVGFVIEELDEMLRQTKGAWDDFEDSSLKYQGWLADVDGTIMLTREQAVSGNYSMKVLDENSGAPTHAVRQVPSMKSGTVGAKLMVPADNEDGFVMELKAAYNFDHLNFTVAAFSVDPDGNVYVFNGDNKTYVTKVDAGSWNDYALTFDVSTGKGQLYVNGAEAGGEFTLPYVDKIHGVTAVQFNQAEGTVDNGDCLYVDDFFATELATGLTRAKQPAPQSLVGKFITIIRDIITGDGKKVQIVEWGWVPGL